MSKKRTKTKTRGWKYKVDNKLRAFGEIDYDRKTIRVNKKKNRKHGGAGELLDTIVHELAHRDHPKMKEKNVKKLAARVINRSSTKKKKKYYNMFNKHA